MKGSKISGRYILPHPAAIIPVIGKEEAVKAAATSRAYEEVAQEIAALQPATIVIISPHAPSFSDHFYFNEYPRLSGDFTQFGQRKLLLGCDNDVAYTRRIYRRAQQEGIAAGPVEERLLKQYGFKYDLDHGVTVPLAFLKATYGQFQLVTVAISGLPPIDHYRLGAIIAAEAAACAGDVVIIASGDLSHKLSKESPYGYHEAGPAFDREVIRCLEENDGLGLLMIDPRRREQAAQCGLDAFYILLGTLEGYDFASRILSYEGPFGIGYLVASLTAGGSSQGSLLTRYRQAYDERQQAAIAAESPPVALARQTLIRYFETGQLPTPPPNLPPTLTEEHGGVFVSLWHYGQLRGCIGTVRATEPTLAKEIIKNTVDAASKDDRFHPLTASELPVLTITIDVIGPLEEVDQTTDLDPQRYGLIVRSGRKEALLLPNLAEITTVEEQIAAAREKAGIHPWRRLQYTRFETAHYT